MEEKKMNNGKKESGLIKFLRILLRTRRFWFELLVLNMISSIGLHLQSPIDGSIVVIVLLWLIIWAINLTNILVGVRRGR
ncbi:hypothetical protein DRO91_05580 [Candidatus Heimdallarchaeota archaeon]|nr:MAG: hypothetical protein DRO91_05580 [Candidatus Heimdallarchaeota archaeon]